MSLFVSSPIVSSYRMVDVSNKLISYRKACAFGTINVGKKVFNMVKNKEIPKGDPILLSEIASINAVKHTSSLILLCHQINIENIFVNFIFDDIKNTISVYCLVSSNSKTGVEIEAMLGVNVALLNIYDLTKKFNPFSFISNVKLLFKDGGKSGFIDNSDLKTPIFLQNIFVQNKKNRKNKIALLTISDRASSGIYFDESGKILYDFFIFEGFDVVVNSVIPDNKLIIFRKFKSIISDYSPDLIITTGGTGLSSKDFTTSVIKQFCDRKISGLGEFLRFDGFKYSNTSWLGDSVAGVYNKTLIVSLPGKPNAVKEGLNAIKSLLFHAIEVIKK